jgi:hypothetical protein
MARTMMITDDLDGSPNAEPVQFEWDGVTWEIDLVEENRKKLEDALKPFLDKAHPANVAQAKSTPTRTRRASGGRTDYSSRENAGMPHRGRVTEAEAAYVRDNLDDVNRRRQEAGHPPLDPKDEKTKNRYGL